MTFNSERVKLHELQMLRAIAASLVVIDHATAQVVTWAGAPSWIGSFGWFLGEQGVAIFFVISGFIMSFTSREFGSSDGSKRFLLRRVARVVPLYWLFTLLSAALIASGLWLKGRTITIHDVLFSLGFIPYGTAPMRPVLGQGWTLEYEMLFYVVFAVAMLFSRRAGHVIVAAVLISGVAIGYALYGTETGDLASNAPAYLLAPYLLLFLAGVAAGYFKLHIRSSRPALLATLVVIIQVTVFLTFKPDFALALWRCVFWSLGFAAVLVCLNGLSAREKQHPIKMFEQLGDASYSLYLSHIFNVYALAKAWRLTIGEQLPWLYIATVVIVSAAVSLLLFKFVERPLYIKSSALVNRLVNAPRRSIGAEA